MPNCRNPTAISSPRIVVVNKLKAGRGNQDYAQNCHTDHYDANSRKKPPEPSHAQKIPKYRTYCFVKGQECQNYAEGFVHPVNVEIPVPFLRAAHNATVTITERAV